jgi:osmotically inducible protein OsmC
MAIEREATVSWEGDLFKGNGILTSGSGALNDPGMTFARRAEDPEGHTTPEELIAAAHAGCYAMSLANTLAQAGTAPQSLEVQAVVALDRTDEGLKIVSSKLTASGRAEGATEESFAEAARLAESTCPVSNALRNNLEIEVETALAG